ncbi:hypothetical protein ACFVSW_20345 [Neobacillus sp. NPDC058068]|uniref:hypothetical protein n=1 Tax=Neobacillus sp. NPDC058068 TaxID=3346325 RepID=UPI0036DBDA91
MNLDKFKIDKCVELINFNSADNILVSIGKVIPHGLDHMSRLFGFTSCNHTSDIFHHIVKHLEPMVYFIISLF